MNISDYDYQEACARLDYIADASRLLTALLSRLCETGRCNFYVDANRFDIAEAALQELVEDLFREETAEANQIKARWQVQDNADAAREWEAR